MTRHNTCATTAVLLLAFSSVAGGQTLLGPTATSNDRSDDDRDEIARAIVAAQAATNPADRTVLFPKNGVFHVRGTDLIPGGVRRTVFHFPVGASGPLQDVVIDGQGSTIVLDISDDGSGAYSDAFGAALFVLNNPSGVTFRNLKIDITPEPYLDGIIQSSGSTITADFVRGFFDARAFNDLAGSGGTLYAFMLDPTVPGVPKNDVPFDFRVSGGVSTFTSPTGTRSFSFTPTVTLPAFNFNYFPEDGGGLQPPSVLRDRWFEVGDRVTLIPRGLSNFRVRGAGDIAFENVVSYASNGGFINAELAGTSGEPSVTVKNCRVAVAPGRWHSTNADGVYVAEARDGGSGRPNGVFVQDSTFSGLCDDAVHIIGTDEFEVSGCVFSGIRGSGVSIDNEVDVSRQRSSAGLVHRNRASSIGGSVVRVRPFPYDRVAIFDNRATGQARSRYVETEGGVGELFYTGAYTEQVQIRSAENPDFAIGINIDLGPGMGDFDVRPRALKMRPLNDPDTVWDHTSCISCASSSSNVNFFVRSNTRDEADDDWQAMEALSADPPNGQAVRFATPDNSGATLNGQAGPTFRFHLSRHPDRSDWFAISLAGKDKYLYTPDLSLPGVTPEVKSGDPVHFIYQSTYDEQPNNARRWWYIAPVEE